MDLHTLGLLFWSKTHRGEVAMGRITGIFVALAYLMAWRRMK